MKKFLVVFAALGLALSAMAQDFNEAVETFNQAAQAESKAEALKLFKQAYIQFVSCGEMAEAQEKVDELKDIIPAYSVAVAKESIASKDYDAAIVALGDAAADCAEFSAEEKAAEDLEESAIRLLTGWKEPVLCLTKPTTASTTTPRLTTTTSCRRRSMTFWILPLPISKAFLTSR